MVASWTFNTGTTSAARLASSNVSAGLTVTALQMNPKADDVGVGANPNTVNDGFGFGGNSGEQVMFFHRANYFNNSTTPTPRPEGRFTTWGGPNIATGVGTTVDLSPMSFTVTTDASTTVTIHSISTNSVGGAYIAHFQEAGALPGAATVADSSNGFDVTPTLNVPVVLLPNSSKTFTVSWNSGNLNSSTLLNQIDLNATVVPEPSTAALAGLAGMWMLLRRRTVSKS